VKADKTRGLRLSLGLGFRLDETGQDKSLHIKLQDKLDPKIHGSTDPESQRARDKRRPSDNTRYRDRPKTRR